MAVGARDINKSFTLDAANAPFPVKASDPVGSLRGIRMLQIDFSLKLHNLHP
jgi:hypothetical protein